MKKNILNPCSVLVLLITISSFSSIAFSSKTNSSLVHKIDSQDQTSATVTFTIEPNEGLVINEEGPWSLKITQNDSVQKHPKKDFKFPQASITTSVKKNKSNEATVEVVAFVCTKDKKNCYRDLHKTTLKL